MKNRGDRLYRKAQIKKRLIEKAIREYNRRQAGFRWNGAYIAPVHGPEELPRSGYPLRLVLRNEGKHRDRIYKCLSSRCEWCVGNLTRKNRRRDAAMEADYADWVANHDVGNVADAFWERNTRWRLALAEVLSLLAHL
ncbi:MAG: hypothetical protein H8F28_03925 [Fibrella sp.]|nr:hypothetical protein [Armatimonadota bacterium]